MQVKIKNLKEFRAALKAAEMVNPRALVKAIKVAGAPALAETARLAPVGSRPDDPHKGQLRGSYALRVSRTTGSIISKAPYGAGAEWGQYGKWKGFAKYGSKGRFAAKAIDRTAPLITKLISEGLREVITGLGWFRGWKA